MKPRVVREIYFGPDCQINRREFLAKKGTTRNQAQMLAPYAVCCVLAPRVQCAVDYASRIEDGGTLDPNLSKTQPTTVRHLPHLFGRKPVHIPKIRK